MIDPEIAQKLRLLGRLLEIAIAKQQWDEVEWVQRELMELAAGGRQ